MVFRTSKGDSWCKAGIVFIGVTILVGCLNIIPRLIVPEDKPNHSTTIINPVITLISYGPTIEFEETIPYYDIQLDKSLQELVYDECRKMNVEYKLALAVMSWENRNYNPTLISSTNDYGLFQVNKVNHRRMAALGYTDMLNAEDNIKAGVYLLAECANDDIHLMLMRYNLGFTGARKARDRGVITTTYSRGVMEIYSRLEEVE